MEGGTCETRIRAATQPARTPHCFRETSCRTSGTVRGRNARGDGRTPRWNDGAEFVHRAGGLALARMVGRGGWYRSGNRNTDGQIDGELLLGEPHFLGRVVDLWELYLFRMGVGR